MPSVCSDNFLVSKICRRMTNLVVSDENYSMDIKSFEISSRKPGLFLALAEMISTFLPRIVSRASESSEYRYNDGDLNLMSKSTSLFSLCSFRATLPNSAILSIPYFSAFSALKVRRISMIWDREAGYEKVRVMQMQRYEEICEVLSSIPNICEKMHYCQNC